MVELNRGCEGLLLGGRKKKRGPEYQNTTRFVRGDRPNDSAIALACSASDILYLLSSLRSSSTVFPGSGSTAMAPYQPQSQVLDTYQAVVSAFSEFLTVAVHTILYERDIYPRASFLSARKYNYPVQQNRHPKVCKWIQDAVAAVETELLKVCISLTAPSGPYACCCFPVRVAVDVAIESVSVSIVLLFKAPSSNLLF